MWLNNKKFTIKNEIFPSLKIIPYDSNAINAVKRFQFVSSPLHTQQYCEYYLLLNSMWNLFTVCDKCSFHLMFSVALTAPNSPRQPRARINYTIVMRSVSCSCWNSRCSFSNSTSSSSLFPNLNTQNFKHFGDTKQEFEMNFKTICERDSKQ